MSTNVGTLVLKLVGDTSQFTSAMTRAVGSLGGFGKLTGAVAAGNIISSAAMRGLSTAVELAGELASKLYEGGEAIVKMGAHFERAQTAFETMVGSTPKGKKLFGDIMQLAVETPFTSQQMIDTSKRLLGFGINPDELIDTMRRLGDIAAGTGSDIDHIGLAYSQVLAKGKLTAEELTRQLGNAGIGAADIAQALGMTQSQLLVMMEKGQVSADMFKKAIVTLTSDGGRFNNAMARDLETVGGRWDQLVESIQLAAGKLGIAFFEKFPVGKAINEVTQALSRIDVSQILTQMEQIGAVMAPAAESAMKFAIGLGLAAKQFGEGLGGGLGMFSAGVMFLIDKVLPAILKFAVAIGNLFMYVADIFASTLVSMAMMVQLAEKIPGVKSVTSYAGFTGNDAMDVAMGIKAATLTAKNGINNVNVDSAMAGGGDIARGVMATLAGLGKGGVTPVGAAQEAAMAAQREVKAKNEAFMKAMEDSMPGFKMGLDHLLKDTDPRKRMSAYGGLMQDLGYLGGAMKRPDLFGGTDAVTAAMLASYKHAAGGLNQLPEPIAQAARYHSQESASLISSAMAQTRGGQTSVKDQVKENIRRIAEASEEQAKTDKEILDALLKMPATNGVGLGGVY